jgi:hypothetical protein
MMAPILQSVAEVTSQMKKSGLSRIAPAALKLLRPSIRLLVDEKTEQPVTERRTCHQKLHGRHEEAATRIRSSPRLISQDCQSAKDSLYRAPDRSSFSATPSISRIQAIRRT